MSDQPIASFDFGLLEEDEALKASMENFLRYSSYRIQEQSLPTFFDGLVPSQRKLLLALQDLKGWHNAKLQKSSRITAQSAAAYHPVGNTYQVLVGMSQDWRVQALLTDPEGNWGEIENGVAAAERYTEIRMSAFGEKVLFEDMPAVRHTTEQTPHSVVPCSITYTDLHWEEDYLPARLPMLLINGSNGIAVGIAQTFQPLAVRPLLSELVNYIKTGTIGYENLRLGYPTQPRITSSQEDFIHALKTGRGSVRSTSTFEYLYNRQKAIVAVAMTATPQGQTLNAIGDSFNEWRAADSTNCPFKNFKNETEGKALRLVFTLERPTKDETEVETAIQALLKRTPLSASHTINMTALKGSFPVIYNLESFFQDWVEERGNIIRRKAEKRLDELTRQYRRQQILLWIKANLEAATLVVKEAETEEILHARLLELPGLEPLLEREEVSIVMELNLRQLSRLNDQEVRDRMARIITERDDQQIIATSLERRTAEILEDLGWFEENLDKLGVPNYVCEFDEGLAAILDKKEARVRTVAGATVTVKDEAPWWQAVASKGSELDILVHTRKGALIRISNKSVRSTPYLPAIVDPEDEILAASFIYSNMILLISDTGRMMSLPKEALPYNQCVYPARVGMLLKLKDVPEFLLPAIALTENPTDLVVIGDGGWTKRVPVKDINSTRQSIAHPSAIRYAALAGAEYQHLAASDLEYQTSIKTAMLTEGSLKRTGRLASVPNLGPASRKENGMFIAVGADKRSIYKRQP